jgi:WD40 repeat protein
VWSLDVSADGARVASAAGDDTVRVWEVATGKSRVVGVGLTGVRWVAFAPDGASVAAAGFGDRVWVCDMDASCRELVGHDGGVWDLAFSPDGAALASAGADQTVRLWNVATGDSRPLRGHTAPVFDVAFSTTGTSLASASGDGDVSIWTVRLP